MNRSTPSNPSEDHPSADENPDDKLPVDVYHEPAHFGVFIALAAGMLGLFLIVLVLIIMAR